MIEPGFNPGGGEEEDGTIHSVGLTGEGTNQIPKKEKLVKIKHVNIKLANIKILKENSKQGVNIIKFIEEGAMMTSRLKLI
tara:strand:- start:278 stop:520 length:243 start_codon:yes stop_codon:yes gene_type:complete